MNKARFSGFLPTMSPHRTTVILVFRLPISDHQAAGAPTVVEHIETLEAERVSCIPFYFATVSKESRASSAFYAEPALTFTEFHCCLILH